MIIEHAAEKINEEDGKATEEDRAKVQLANKLNQFMTKSSSSGENVAVNSRTQQLPLVQDVGIYLLSMKKDLKQSMQKRSELASALYGSMTRIRSQ